MEWTDEEFKHYQRLQQGKYGHFSFSNRCTVKGKLVRYETLIVGKMWLFEGSSGRYIVRYAPNNDGNRERNGNIVCECIGWRMSGHKRICKHTEAIILNGEIDFHELVDLTEKRSQLGQKMYGEAI